MIPVALTAAVAPVRLFAPRPEPVAGPATVAELIAVCRATGSTGRALADAAVQAVAWLAGHAWVKVVVDGHELDACASTAASRVGHPPFVVLTSELPLRTVTRWATGIALVPFVVVEVWRSWLAGRPVAPWVYGPREG